MLLIADTAWTNIALLSSFLLGSFMILAWILYRVGRPLLSAKEVRDNTVRAMLNGAGVANSVNIDLVTNRQIAFEHVHELLSRLKQVLDNPANPADPAATLASVNNDLVVMLEPIPLRAQIDNLPWSAEDGKLSRREVLSKLTLTANTIDQHVPLTSGDVKLNKKFTYGLVAGLIVLIAGACISFYYRGSVYGVEEVKKNASTLLGSTNLYARKVDEWTKNISDRYDLERIKLTVRDNPVAEGIVDDRLKKLKDQYDIIYRQLSILADSMDSTYAAIYGFIPADTAAQPVTVGKAGPGQKLENKQPPGIFMDEPARTPAPDANKDRTKK